MSVQQRDLTTDLQEGVGAKIASSKMTISLPHATEVKKSFAKRWQNILNLERFGSKFVN